MAMRKLENSMRRKCNVMISQTAQFVRRLVSVLIVASIVGCASQPVQGPIRSTGKSHSTAGQAAAVAMQQIGVPYRYGGATPHGFDCSGLIYYSYSKVGKNVPRTTGSLWSGIRPVAKSQMQVGDVLFFRIEGKMSHVGMYIGDNQFVHAPSSGKVVTVGSLQSDFYRKALLRAGRPY
jgi:cell wall-associated NlpC family hydrolase